MTHPNPTLGSQAAARSTPRHSFRPALLVAAALAATSLLSSMIVWIAAPLSASAGSQPVTIDVIVRTTSFRPLPNDGSILTQNLFDKRSGAQVGSDIFYCLEAMIPSSGSQTLAECPGTASFNGKGTVSVLGSFLVPPTVGQSWTVAVVGGTDRYRNVRGELKVTQISPTEEEGIFTLLG